MLNEYRWWDVQYISCPVVLVEFPQNASKIIDVAFGCCWLDARKSYCCHRLSFPENVEPCSRGMRLQRQKHGYKICLVLYRHSHSDRLAILYYTCIQYGDVHWYFSIYRVGFSKNSVCVCGTSTVWFVGFLSEALLRRVSYPKFRCAAWNLQLKGQPWLWSFGFREWASHCFLISVALTPLMIEIHSNPKLFLIKKYLMILLKSLEFCIRFAPDVGFPPWSRNWAPVGAKRAARDPRAEEVWMHSLCWSNIALSLSPATGWMLGWYRWYLVMAAVTCWVSHRISWSTWVQDLMYGSITCLNLEDSDGWWDDITVYYSNISWSSGKPANIKYARIYYICYTVHGRLGCVLQTFASKQFR